MAIKQIVPIYITLLGDAAATTFVFPVQNLFQQGFGGSVPFGVTGSIPSSASANNPPYPVTSVAVDANGNITITFTSAPPAVEFQLELDITFNSGSATSSTPTVSQNVTLTGTSTVTISGTAAVNLTQLNGVALGSPSNYGTSPGAVSVQGVNAFITNTVPVTLTSTTITGTVAVTQSTSPWVVSLTSTTITGTVAVTQSGTWTVQQGGAPWSQVGTLTHNNAAPAANNVGALVAVASTAAPTYTTGDQVLLSTDLAGNLRVSSAGGTQSSNIIQWNSVALGSPSAYGTSPGAVNVIGVNAFVTNTVPVTLTSTTITGTVAVTQSTSPWTVSGDSASGAAKAGNPVQIGGVFNTTQPTVTTGQTVEAQSTARGAQIVATGVDTFNVTVNTALPAGANVIGAVTQSGGPWTINETQLNSVALGSPSNYGTSPGAVSVQGVNAFVTNTVAVTLTSTTVTGTVAVTQSTSPWVVAGGLTHNNAAPAANNVGVLPAVASTAAPTYTTGDQVLLSTDLSGNLRVSGTFASGALVDLVGTLVALNALNTAATINAFGYLAVGGFLAAGTLVGTIVAETSFDGGTTWTGTYFDIGNKVSSIVFGSANTATSFSIIGSAGASNYRVRVSAFTSGTANCTLRADQIHDPTVEFTGLTAATVQPPLAAQMGGWVTTAAPTYTTATFNAASLTTAGGLRSDNSSWAGTALGAPSNYGTSPGAVTVPGVNAFVTNTVAVSLTSTTITGTVAVTQSTSPWVTNVTQWASTALGTPQTFGTAPTGVVIGTSSDLYVAGTRARSNQTTTAAGVQDVNIVGSLGATNSVTNGTFIAITDNTTKAGVIAATTALKTDMSSVAGTATVTAAAGVQKVGIVGNTGATLDSTIGAATAPTNAIAVGHVYNTTPPALTNGQAAAAQCDTAGAMYVNNEGHRNTYRAAIVGFTPVASSGSTSPLWSIQGSASKTIRVTRVHLIAWSTTGTAIPTTVTGQKFTVLTGGTVGNTATNIANDGNNAASTATVVNYSALPTTATSSGTVAVDAFQWTTLVATSQTIPTAVEWRFGNDGGQQIVLRGTGQYFGITVSSIGTGATVSMNIWVEWIEDNS